MPSVRLGEKVDQVDSVYWFKRFFMMTRMRELYSWLQAPASEAMFWFHSELKSLNVSLITQAELRQAMAIARVEAKRVFLNTQGLAENRPLTAGNPSGLYVADRFDFEKYIEFLAYFSDILVKNPHLHWAQMVLMYVQKYIEPNSQQKMIDNLFNKAVIGCVTLLVKRLVEMNGPIAPSQWLIDLELLKAINVKAWPIVRVLIAMDGPNKPSQEAMNDALVRLAIRYDRFDIMQTLRKTTGSNKPTQEAVDEALELLAAKRGRFRYLQALMSDGGSGGPSNEAIATALVTSIQVGNIPAAKYLIIFVRKNGSSSVILHQALVLAVKYHRLEMVSILVGIGTLWRPNLELLNIALTVAFEREQFDIVMWLSSSSGLPQLVNEHIIQKLIKLNYPKKSYVLNYDRGVIQDDKVVINLVQVLYALFLEKQTDRLFVALIHYLIEHMSFQQFPEAFMAMVLIDFSAEPQVNSVKNIAEVIHMSDFSPRNRLCFFKSESPEKWVCNALLDGDATLLANKKDPRRVRGFIQDTRDAIQRYRGITATQVSSSTIQVSRF